MTFPDLPAPRWGTERNPQRETLGPKVALVARKLGWDLMPWQRLVLDVGCEIDSTTGQFWYRDVRTLEPRQSGKTTIFVAKGVHRAATTRNGKIIYTAQDRQKALTRLEENYYERILERWRPILKPTRNPKKPGWYGRTGDEKVQFTTNAKIFIDAVNEKSGHGGTNDEWHCDEAFAHRDGTVAQNIRPTLITVDGAQIWHQSAAGKLGYSKYWWNLVQDGRAIVEAADPRARIAFFEWSDDPDADRDDRARWPLYMPAYGITIHEHTIDAELQAFATNLDEYDRAYRGIWTGNKRPDPIIPVDAWRDTAAPDNDEATINYDHPPMWCVDMSPDHEWTSIAVAGAPTDPDARVAIALVDHELGNGWVIDRMRDLTTRFGGNRVALAGDGAAMSLKQDLEDAGFEVIVLPKKDIASACGELLNDAVNRRLVHTNDDTLNESLASAAKRAYGNAWVWWHGSTMADITPVYAVTLARHAYLTNAEPDYDATLSVY